jgi:aryl-alcohol dehydrogenase-like predicted oxidoreductase
MAALSTAWALSKPDIACVLLGSRNKSDLLDNVAASELKLDKAVIAEIDSLSLPILQKLGNSPDYYENRTKTRSW